jgi:hypothetical protein
MERPAFVRRTKHSGVGHEDIRYSYVVVRRGPRPAPPDIKVGRLGEVGRRQLQLEEAKRPLVELQLDVGNSQVLPTPTVASTIADKTIELHGSSPADMQKLIKAEAFHWPRLISPPLKKSGHIIMDVCSPSGSFVNFACSNPLTSNFRQNFAYDYSEVSREATIPRRPQI